jgi:hypothetical protein
MKYSLKFTLIFVVFLGIQACDQSEDNAPDTSNEEFPDLKIFLDRFENEAKLRGYNFNFSGLDIAYVDFLQSSDGVTLCGYGYTTHPQTGRRTVLISKARMCEWSSKSDLDRESLFFHELGHAFLNLPHDEAKMCNGRYLSIMTETVNQSSFYTKDEPELRRYYLDELLDRSAAKEQCIDFGQDFHQDPVFFRNVTFDQVWRSSNDGGNYQFSRGVYSNTNTPYLGIASSGNGKNTGYIYRQLDVPNIPEGATVILRTKVNAENLEGPGVAIAMRVYATKIGTRGASIDETHTLTTEPNPVNGKLENHVLELRLPNFTRKTIFLIPFAVMMPGTKGQAFFDDFEILVEPK